MGHLLSSAIKMQGTASAPTTATLEYYVSGIFGGEVIMWKNGLGILDTTVDVPLTSVSVNAGDTMYMQFTSGGPFTTYIYYYFNGTLTATFSGTTTFSSTIYTASAGNTYKFGYEGLA